MPESYTTQEIAKMLGVESVTIRKYCLALEGAGYTIRRTQTGRRIFFEKDATVLKHMRTLLQQSAMPVGNCAKVIVARNMKRSESVMEPEMNQLTTEEERYEERYVKRYDEAVAKLELLDHIPTIVGQIDQVQKENAELKKQVERLSEALNYITQQNQTMSNVMSDRDKALMDAIHNMEEIKQTQQQVAAALEERNTKRGWWPFGRK